VIARRPCAYLALLLASLWGCSTPPEDYASRIAAERAAKDEMFRTAEDSPLEPDDRSRFLPLSYFPIDESYAVPAQLEPAAQRETIQIPTSTGQLRQMQRIGELRFALNGQPMRLSTFLEDDGRLFVPFTDLTSGTETYPAGRYLNLTPTATGIYVVDFNGAYHPYCYYNASYDCPFPPPENRLQTPIRAGERLPRAETSVP
jgi:uncharacterized protein (DUF1684 family)